jgi:predicted GNAT family acetyltransferase
MMRQLQEHDRDSILNYLYQDPHRNIFPIGDIETFGFDQDFQQLYADFAEDGSINSVFLRYRTNGIFYSITHPSPRPYEALIASLNLDYISMVAPLADHWQDVLSRYERSDMYFAVCDTGAAQGLHPASDVVLAKEDDMFGALYDLFLLVPEFHIDLQTKNEYIESKRKSTQMGVTLCRIKDDLVLSTVATTAETTRSAMVVSVATHPGHRHQGHASELLQDLILRYRDKGKDLCLFYDNPDAGRIYRRLGFQEDGMWTIYRRRTTQ